MKEIKHVLTTGGYDSTFMLCKLGRKDIIIQPHYVIFERRRSTDIELERLRIILNELPKKPGIQAVFKPLQVHQQSECEPCKKTEAAYKKCWDKYSLGWQYLYLAELSRKYPGIAIGQEHYSFRPGRLSNMLFKDGHMIFTEDGTGYLPDDADADVLWLFKDYTFPIANISEQMMISQIEKWNYEDIMSYIWFCYSDQYNGEPCGMCNPCIGKIRAHMYMLFPDSALYRYLLNQGYEVDTKKIDRKEIIKRIENLS